MNRHTQHKRETTERNPSIILNKTIKTHAEKLKEEQRRTTKTPRSK